MAVLPVEETDISTKWMTDIKIPCYAESTTQNKKYICIYTHTQTRVKTAETRVTLFTCSLDTLLGSSAPEHLQM